jgi:VanZ family protein
MQVQLDKKLHFVVSLVLVFIFFLLTQNIILSANITLFIGFLKEIYDKYFGTGFSWADIIANIIGVVFGILLLGGLINVK